MDIDLFVLDECDPWSCTEGSSTPLDLQTYEKVDFQAQARRDYVVAVDGYSGASGSYVLTVDCLCGEGELDFSDGEWLLNVDRRWNGQTIVASSSTQLPEDDYEPVANGPSYATRVSGAWQSVSVGDTPWLGEVTAHPPAS